jgi:hypothetical protein
MQIRYNTVEELKKAVWRLFSQGKDVSVDMKNLVITIHNTTGG